MQQGSRVLDFISLQSLPWESSERSSRLASRFRFDQRSNAPAAEAEASCVLDLVGWGLLVEIVVEPVLGAGDVGVEHEALLGELVDGQTVDEIGLRVRGALPADAVAPASACQPFSMKFWRIFSSWKRKTIWYLLTPRPRPTPPVPIFIYALLPLVLDTATPLPPPPEIPKATLVLSKTAQPTALS